MKNAAKTAAIVVLSCTTLALGLLLFADAMEHIKGKVPTASRQAAVEYMPAAEEIFRQRQAEFERISELMVGRENVTVDLAGIRVGFGQDKESVFLSGEMPVFTQEELGQLTHFFRGVTYSTSSPDAERLEMWKIRGGDSTLFTMYIKGDVELVLVRWPNAQASPKTMWPAYEVWQLGDGWVMMALDRAMPTEQLFALYEENGPVQAEPVG